MNRFRKEEKRKLAAHVGGLSEIYGEYVGSPYNDPEFLRKVMALHVSLFSEEHDFQMDSSADIKLRSCGISPMSQDYLHRVNFRRLLLGVPKISGVETSISEESWDFCLKKVVAEQAS